MVVKQAVPCIGFDVNEQLTEDQYKLFKGSGYDFVIRYIPRTVALIKGNLTMPEIDVILKSDLSLLVVQHVSNPGWMPAAVLGEKYGQYAATYCEIIALPKGASVWLDLEEVAESATAQQVIDYCNQWYSAVHAVGYVPGIYCGFGCGLSPKQLYENLHFRNYWRAYNGPEVETRGFQIVQHTQKSLNGIDYDPNTIQADNKGDLPMWLSPS